jgi:excinuclease ABC subunit B
MAELKVISEMKPRGDQPKAIERLAANVRSAQKYNVLLGVTGSGKTFTMAHVIERAQKPTLVISHNKTLAAQLYEEFKELFPQNAVEYFVSYYDYYQPEAYIPQRDIYIEKDASRNDDLDRLRLSTTTSLMSRKDVIIVASVSCIFGLGSPEEYKSSVAAVRVGMRVDRNELLRGFVNLQYDRNDVDFKRGTFRVRGDTVEIYPASPDKSDHGRGPEQHRPGVHLPGRPLRRAGGHNRAGRRDHKAGVGGAADRAEERRQAAGGPAAFGQDAIRHGDAHGGRLLPRHRELLPPP